MLLIVKRFMGFPHLGISCPLDWHIFILTIINLCCDVIDLFIKYLLFAYCHICKCIFRVFFDNMSVRRLQSLPNKTGPPRTRPRRLTVLQCFVHHLGVKCARAQSCPCRSSGQFCTSVCPLYDCFKKGPLHTPLPRGGFVVP